MNATLTTITHPATALLLRAALATAATVLLTVGSAWAESPATAQATVRYADLDLASADGAATLYRRIENAARRVCTTGGRLDLQAAQGRRACQQAAIDRAVATIGHPQLAAVHARHLRRA